MQLSSQKTLILRSVFKIFIHLEFRPFPQASINNFTPSHGTQTFWVFLTLCTHASPQHQNPDCICSPLSPAAAVYLIHDPAIIRQSPVGPFLAWGDRGKATKYIIFQGNICKWRRGGHFPIFDRGSWHVVNRVNILLRFKHNRQASSFVFYYQILKKRCISRIYTEGLLLPFHLHPNINKNICKGCFLGVQDCE